MPRIDANVRPRNHVEVSGTPAGTATMLYGLNWASNSPRSDLQRVAVVIAPHVPDAELATNDWRGGRADAQSKEQKRRRKVFGLFVSHYPGFELSPRGIAVLEASGESKLTSGILSLTCPTNGTDLPRLAARGC